MDQEPYRSAPRVFWIVDNGSSHRGRAAIERLQRQWPNIEVVHLPIHASWLNQIEIYFSIVQRKLLTPYGYIHAGHKWMGSSKTPGVKPVTTIGPILGATLYHSTC